MKRHPVLHKLSEDHHHGLLQVRHLRQATAANVAGRVRSFLSAWRREIAPHFIEEEVALLPFVCPPLAPDHPAIRSMEEQHIAIRRLVLDLQRAQRAGDEVTCLTLAGRLAEALEAHIQLEEREVFEAIQEALDDTQIVALGDFLTAWESAAAARPD